MMSEEEVHILKNLYTMTNVIILIRPQDVIIFIVGGTTYEESRSVALENANNSGIRFILGGSVILNSKRYAMNHYKLFLILGVWTILKSTKWFIVFGQTPLLSFVYVSPYHIYKCIYESKQGKEKAYNLTWNISLFTPYIV